VLIIVVMVFYPGGLWGMVQEARGAFVTWYAGLRAAPRRRCGRPARQALMRTPEFMLPTRHGRVAVSDSDSDSDSGSGGAGPAILLIHGNSACKEAFARQFSALRADHRLIAFDLPGHGVSDNASPETA
jgi:pimeloyl-ACP methyl ester carboxylesterase